MCQECIEIQEKAKPYGCGCGCWPLSMKKTKEVPTEENTEQKGV